MPTYATITDLQAYAEGIIVDDEAATNRIIARAEADVDSVLAGPMLPSGLKYDPAVTDPTVAGYLTDLQKLALRRATCAQAEYRIAKGEDFFIHAQYRRVSGPEFTTEGTLPYLGPKAVRELAGMRLLSSSIAGIASIRLTSDLSPLA